MEVIGYELTKLDERLYDDIGYSRIGTDYQNVIHLLWLSVQHLNQSVRVSFLGTESAVGFDTVGLGVSLQILHSA